MTSARVRIITPLRLVVALALVGGTVTAIDFRAFLPRWSVVFTWTGEGRNPAAFAISVGPGHGKTGQKDWNDVGYHGRFSRSGGAKTGDFVVASGLPTESNSYMTCVLSIDDVVVDKDPKPGREPVRGNGALCKGVVL